MSERKIFAEVETSKSEGKSTTGLIDAGKAGSQSAILRFLWGLFGFLILMIVVGGLTRLTDSGLSITEWKPITGAIPPLSEADWNLAFSKYKEIPEFQLQNSDMTLPQFKVIYWWEWGHRQLGRLIGLFWLLGFVFLALRGMLSRPWFGRIALLGALGALQATIGWWMVSSGLEGRMLDVASYRLALHLGIAFFILSLVFWYTRELSQSPADRMTARRNRDKKLERWGNILLICCAFQILLGALVAGIDAGRSYSDWPLMAGQIIPSEAFDLTPLAANFFENAALVQFNHRVLGYILGGLVIFAYLAARHSGNPGLKRAFLLAKIGVWLQMALGVITIWLMAHWSVAIFHQLLAVGVICLTLNARFLATYPPKMELR